MAAGQGQAYAQETVTITGWSHPVYDAPCGVRNVNGWCDILVTPADAAPITWVITGDPDSGCAFKEERSGGSWVECRVVDGDTITVNVGEPYNGINTATFTVGEPLPDSSSDDDAADSSSDDDAAQYPCADLPSYTCAAQAPTGTGVTAIHNDGETVTIDEGNNGIDDTDDSHDYDATTPATTSAEAQAKKDALDAVNDIASDQMAVMTAGNGQQSSEQQENAFSIEQQLWERGEPYMVCFDPVTYTNSNGEEVTVESDCVIVTPN